MKCSVFTDLHTVSEDRDFGSILESIKDGSECGEKIKRIRQLIKDNDTEAAAALKKTLPAFTPAGMFNKIRNKSKLSFYSGIVHLDLDHIPDNRLDEIIKTVQECEFTYACFISVSGAGLKIFVRVSSHSPEHEIAIKQVSEFYSSLLNFPPDTACKDISRLCFFSHDPDLFINTAASTFNIQPIQNTMDSQVQPVPQPVPSTSSDWTPTFQAAVEFTNKKHTYVNHHRNIYVHALACNCNRLGIPESETLKLSLQSFDLPANEITSSTQSAYKNNPHEFAKFADFAALQNVENEIDYLLNTPVIPQSCYDSLPILLQKGCKVFTDPRECDVFLTGALAILSGCLPNVKGLYNCQLVFPNLFSFIIAPAASGKGALVFAKQLAMHYHSELITESDKNKKNYASELDAYYSRRKKNKETTEEMPEKPPYKVLFIPANASYAKIIQHLKENNGSSIICETEADSMGNALKQDWGNYSDMLRKAFHHECISSSKKTNDEYIEVNRPMLSVALSGTPNQVTNLISSAEDGLFSRFFFYAFKANHGWKDVSPNSGGVNLTEHFSNLSTETYSLVQFLSKSPTEVQLTESQWKLLNEQCSIWLDSTIIISGEEAASIVKRLGLIMYRLAILFTSLRKFENGNTELIQVCSELDFQNALLLSSVYLEHSILMFSNLPKQASSKQFRKGSNKQLLFDSLPGEFKRMEAVSMGTSLNLSPRTVDEILRVSVQEEKLQLLKAGLYKKNTS